MKPTLSLVGISTRHPRLTMIAWLAFLTLCGSSLHGLRFDLTGNSTLERSSEAWRTYQQSLDWFGGDEILVVALTGPVAYHPDTLRQIRRLSSHFESLEGIRRVDSIATVPSIEASPDGALRLDPPLSDEVGEGVSDVELVRRRLEHDRIAPRSLVSPDGRSFAINLLLEPDFEDFSVLVQEVREEIGGLDAAVSGVPVFRVEINRHTQREIGLLAPVTAVILISVLIWLLGSRFAALLCILPGACGLIAALAAMAALDLPVTVFTLILPPVLLALSCAYAMHLVALEGELSRRHELWRELEVPVALSGLTTAIGFGALAVVRLDSVRWLGQLGALGVVITLIGCLTLVPALATLAPRASEVRPRLLSAMRRLAQWLGGIVAERRASILIGWLFVAVVTGAGLANLRIETDLTTWLRPEHRARVDYEWIRDALSGISPVNIVIEPADGRDVLDPDVLRKVDGLSQHLARQPGVGKAISIADPLRQIHGGFVDDLRAPLSMDRTVNAQYLLLLDGIDQIDDLITSDHRVANVLLRVDDNRSRTLTALGDEARRWWAASAAPPAEVDATGIMYEYARAEDEVAIGQLRGLALAFLMIAGVLGLTLRSLRLALISLLPNVAPLVVIYGVTGLLALPVDLGMALVGNLAIGIAVDDTVHVMHAFGRARHAGSDPSTALSVAYAEVLRPIVYSTVALVAGFAAFTFSAFALTRNLGIFTVAILVLCLVADVTLLGALLSSRRSAGKDERGRRHE